MEYYIERLNYELQSIIKFWQNYAIKDNRFATEVSNEGSAQFNGPLGSVYLARILYGTSAACRHFNNHDFKTIADLAYSTLLTKLSNPNGGYHWAVDENGNIVHDAMNYSFAQAFIVYGMSEYYALTGNSEVKKNIFHQIDFIESKIKNPDDNSYIDGFSPDWLPIANQKRSLGTHLHLLEGYVNFMHVTNDTIYKRSIEHMLTILIDHFIDQSKGEVHHMFNMEWNPEPDEIWIGHNVEAAWILLKSASTIKQSDLIITCREILISLCNNAIEKGFDRQYGGMFNRFQKDKQLTTDKEWWTQTESVIAFFSAYHVSNDKKFLSYAIRLLEYIDNTFTDRTNGEWYETVTREGRPIGNRPKLHMWKSMYHNVRYCIEVSKHLQKLFATVT
jgi:mannobiose 2-epimerase